MIYSDSIQIEHLLQVLQDKVAFYCEYRKSLVQSLASDEYQDLAKRMIFCTNILEYTLRFSTIEFDEYAEYIDCNELLEKIALRNELAHLNIVNKNGKLPTVFCNGSRLEELFYSLLSHAAELKATTVEFFYQDDQFILEDNRQVHLLKKGEVKLFKQCEVSKGTFLKKYLNLFIALNILNFYDSGIEMKRDTQKTVLKFIVPEWVNKTDIKSSVLL